MKCIQTAVVGAVVWTLGATGFAASWKDNVAAPVTNPVFFEDPFIRSEIEPVFLWTSLDGALAPGVDVGGDIFLYAAQIRYALTDRLAIIATKDGYVDANPRLLAHEEGFADLALGIKYALIDNEEHEFILTPGFEVELPTGNQDVFQGNGMGEWDFFVAAAKGCEKAHAVANVGVRIPNNFADETAGVHYSLQLDYHTCRYFIPFVSLNAFTTLNSASHNGGLPIGLPFEGADLINFGSSQAAGETDVFLGGGFSSHITEKIAAGVGCEIALTEGFYDQRVTVSMNIGF